MAKLPSLAVENAVANTEEKPTKSKRNFTISDDRQLYAMYPQFFKLVPDYAKIRQAMKLGIPLPGVHMNDDPAIEAEEDHGYIEDAATGSVQRL